MRAAGALAAVAAAAIAVLPASAGASEIGSLRAQADRAGMVFGAAVVRGVVADPEFAALLGRHVNTVVAENDMKWNALQPTEGTWNFSGADQIADFAWERNMLMRGHTFIWHRNAPAWVEGMSGEQALAAMRAHIRTVGAHFRERYPGLVVEWDVVNEAISEDGTGLRDSVWKRTIGNDYVAQAFRIAREELGPDVKLIYNDYIPEGLPPGAAPNACDAHIKCRAIRGLVASLVSGGTPIDGVGLQAHTHEAWVPDFAGLTSWVRGLGLRLAITEFDAPQPLPTAGTADALDLQRRKYEAGLAACVQDSACDSFVMWGLSDRRSWWNTANSSLIDPLPFDRAYAPKPAAFALEQRLAAVPDGAEGSESLAKLKASLQPGSVRTGKHSFAVTLTRPR